MPARNTLKVYVENGYYHIYNRGVEKRTVFEDEQDYKVFLKYIKEALSPADEQELNTKFVMQGLSLQSVRRPVKSYFEKVKMLAYCLIPNHFHFLVQQIDKDALEGFMRSLMTRYSMYFNKKYDRVGSLFQGRYKGVLVDNEAYLLHLSRYIHLNPREYSVDLEKAHSSYTNYLGKQSNSWLHPCEILSFFNQTNVVDFRKVGSYKDFVEKYEVDSGKILGSITLE